MSLFSTHARGARVGAITLVVGAFGTLPTSVWSGDRDARPDLSLQSAVEQALRLNPDLAAAPYLLRAAEARVAQAGLRPAPELSVQVEDILGSGRTRGFSGAQTTFVLSQVIELGGRRDGRVDAASTARDLATVEYQARQLDVLAEVTRRFIEVAAGQERLALSRRGVDLAGRTTAEVRQRVDAAKAPDVDLRRAGIAESRARLALENAEHELLSARHQLAAMWGSTQAHFGEVSADLYRLPVVGTFEQIVTRLRSNPDFLRFASEARLRDAELRLAQSRRRPDVQVGVGLRRLQDSRDEALVASVSMPLFAGNRSAGMIAEAQNRRAVVGLQQEAAFVRTQAQLFELYQELGHALNEATVLRDEVLPALEAVLRQAEVSYRRGRYAYIEWTAVQGELLDAQRALIEAAADAHRYLAEIERLTGEPVAVLQN